MCFVFFCQAEDGIRYLVRSRGLGDVYKRQLLYGARDQGPEPVRARLTAFERDYIQWVTADAPLLSLIHI